MRKWNVWASDTSVGPSCVPPHYVLRPSQPRALLSSHPQYPHLPRFRNLGSDPALHTSLQPVGQISGNNSYKLYIQQKQRPCRFIKSTFAVAKVPPSELTPSAPGMWSFWRRSFIHCKLFSLRQSEWLSFRLKQSTTIALSSSNAQNIWFISLHFHDCVVETSQHLGSPVVQ